MMGEGVSSDGSDQGWDEDERTRCITTFANPYVDHLCFWMVSLPPVFQQSQLFFHRTTLSEKTAASCKTAVPHTQFDQKLLHVTM